MRRAPDYWRIRSTCGYLAYWIAGQDAWTVHECTAALFEERAVAYEVMDEIKSAHGDTDLVVEPVWSKRDD